MSNDSVTVKYLTAAQVSARWGSSVALGTLANWRSQRVGPRFVKFRSKVLYPIADIEAWEISQGFADAAA